MFDALTPFEMIVLFLAGFGAFHLCRVLLGRD
jgi:hypothetical protein